MNRKLLALACLAALAIAACKREEAPAPAAAEPAPAAAPAVVESAPTGETAATAASFDMKAFAGTFSAGATTIELKPDGTYLAKDGDQQMDGTWTAEEGDTRIRLDPNTKAQDDRLFQIGGNDALVAIDEQGTPLAGDRALELRRGGQ